MASPVTPEAFIWPRPAWMADAVCKEHPEVDFFPGQGGDCSPAIAICAGCLVQPECRAYAVADSDIMGVWGGTTAAERRRLRRSAA